MPSLALQSLIEQYAPTRPWCGSEKNAAKRRLLSTALTLPYMQLNKSTMAGWLIVDIDYPDAAHAWEDVCLPPPTYIAINPKNGHAHIGYALTAPVCMTDRARCHPRRYLAAIESAYVLRLNADKAFSGPLAKNPLHERWQLWEPANCPTYELGLLADYVDLPNSLPANPQPDGLSRNCDLQKALVKWASKAIREFWGSNDKQKWSEACATQALAFNTFPVPLSSNEVFCVARSVARWTWKNITPAGFSALQSARGKKGGIASGQSRKAASEEMRATARILAAQGLSNRCIAKQLGVSHPTISSWLSDDSKVAVVSEALAGNSA